MSTENVAVTLQPSRVLSRGASSRSRAIDVLRLLAIFQMVQGHTIDAVLASVHRVGSLHALWQSARGLTSVAFLFLAGVGYAFATRSESGRAPAARSRRVRRGLMLIAIGYAMRAPVPALLGLSDTSLAVALSRATIVDVLQCIGLTLLVLEALSRSLPDDLLRRSVTAGLAIALFALAPLCAGLDPSGGLRFLIAYVTSAGGSLFPLVPWAAHALLGAAIGPVLFEREGRVQKLVVLGSVMIPLGMGLAALVHPVLGQVGRLGAVLLVCAGLVRIEAVFSRLPAWVLRVAQHSLLIYVLHVVLAYGEGFGLVDVVGRRLSPLPAAVIALAMLTLCAGAALLYDGWKARTLA